MPDEPATVADDRLPRGRGRLSTGVHVHFDGACEPPRGGGVATYGFTIEGPGLDYEERGLAVRPWSSRATNNVAEYVAAIRALEWLSAHGYTGPVVLLGDSQLVVRQMLGQYRVKAAHLREYREQLHRLAQRFEKVDFVWIPREVNRRADELTKRALQEAMPDASRLRPDEPSEPEVEEEDPDSAEGGV